MTNSPTLEAFSRQVHDHRTIFATQVGQRKLVYLDHNAWIELRDLKTAEAVACLAACRWAVERQKVIFPLAYPAISEAIEIGDRTTRLLHADLLDSLSNGITFRSKRVLFKLEAVIAYRWLLKDEESHIPREDVLTSLPDYLGEGQLSFPAGWTPEMAAQLMTYLAHEPKLRSVRFIAEQRDRGVDHVLIRERYVFEMEKNRQERLGNAGEMKQGKIQRALLRERLALVKQYVIPVGEDALFNEVVSQGAAAAFKQLKPRKGEGGNRRVRELFERMPMMDQHARLFALGAMEVRRRSQAQDFYDFDHGTVPPIYADAFVTLDKRLARLVEHAGRGSADLVTSLRELQRWLESQCAD